MKTDRLVYVTVLLAGAFFFSGCVKTSVATPDGKILVYKFDKTSPTGPDISQIKLPETKAEKPANQKEWAKKYDDQVAAKAAAEKAKALRIAKAKAAKKAAMAAKKAAPKTLAAKADIDAAKARLNELKGSVKMNGAAIVGIKLAASDTGENVLSVADMELFGRLLDLQSVSFEGAVFTDEMIAPLANLKNLNSVTINNANIQDATLEMLATLPELRFLDIRRDLKLTNDSLKILQKMPKLEELHAHYNSFTNSGMAKINKAVTLKIVDVRGCPDVSDNGAKYLAKLPELEEVYFRGMISNAGVEHLANAPKMKFIEFQDCKDINEGSVESFKKMAELKGLRFFRCKGINDATLQGLAAIPLTRLELRDMNISNEGIAAFKNHPTIKDMEIAELASVDAAGLTDLLANLKDFNRLVLFAVPLSDEGVALIAQNMPNLKELTIRGVPITDTAIDSVLKLKNLETLDIRTNTQISADAMLKLKELKNLKTLYVKETGITASGNDAKLAELKAALPKCRVQE